ncbi:MAG: hypothetical protein R3B96_08175 [Pirellulaceae bacterium]
MPILSSKCFVCRGPDTHDPDMLRLDNVEDTIADRGGYRAVWEAEDAPERMARFSCGFTTESDPMPPDDAEKQLTGLEREILSRWIEQGGDYERHWSFVPPVKLDPADRSIETASEAIDVFVARSLSERGLSCRPRPIVRRSPVARPWS